MLLLGSADVLKALFMIQLSFLRLVGQLKWFIILFSRCPSVHPSDSFGPCLGGDGGVGV